MKEKKDGLLFHPLVGQHGATVGHTVTRGAHEPHFGKEGSPRLSPKQHLKKGGRMKRVMGEHSHEDVPDRLSIRLEPVAMVAIQQAADQARLSKSDFMRQLAGFVTGVDRPDLQELAQKVQDKYPRATLKAMVEAAWEYYLHLAIECGLDGNLYPDISPAPKRRR